MASIRRSSPLTSTSFSVPSALALPASIRKNSSFARLASLVGLGKWTGAIPADADNEDEDEDDGEEGELSSGSEETPIDEHGGKLGESSGGRSEEALVWDAKAALTAHQPLLAIELYTTAALPPYRSAQACLALGNILLKDAHSPKHSTPPTPPQSRKGKEKATSPLANISLTQSAGSSMAPLRDVETMGIVGGWLVLGIAWIVQPLLADRRHAGEAIATLDEEEQDPFVGVMDDDETLLMTRKHHPHHPHHSHRAHQTTQTHAPPLELLDNLLKELLQLYRENLIRADDPVALPPITSLQLPEVLKPHGDASRGRNAWYQGRIVAERLLSLESLRDKTSTGSGGEEDQQRRVSVLLMANFILGLTSPNAESTKYWKGVIAAGSSDLLDSQELINEASERLEKFILDSPGLILKSHRHRTSSKGSSKASSKYPARMVPSGLPSNATDRAVTSPHPHSLNQPRLHSRTSASPQRLHRRDISISSFTSAASGASRSRLVSFTIKPSPSQASLTLDSETASIISLSPRRSGSSRSALDALRQIHSRMHAEDYDDEHDQYTEHEEHLEDEHEDEHEHDTHSSPAASSLPSSPRSLTAKAASSPATSLEPSPRGSAGPLPSKSKNLEASRRAEVPTIRTIASTPILPHVDLNSPPPPTNFASGASTPRRKLPFEPTKDQRIAGVDPALAAAELSSALTKHVQCGVCMAKGVNFPNCPKCGLTFCSRTCRVDVDKAGNGLKHVCGAWESRKLLSVPRVAANGRMENEKRAAPIVVH